MLLQFWIGLTVFAGTEADSTLIRLRLDQTQEATEELINLGFKGRYDSPAKYILPARSRVNLPSTNDQLLLKAKLHNLLGLLYRNIGIADSSALYFLKASAGYSEHGLNRFNSAEYNLMNLYATQLDDPTEALRIGKNLVSTTRDFDDVPNLIMTLDALAQVYWKLDSVKVALQTAYEALRMSRNQNADSGQLGLLFRKVALYSCFLPEKRASSLLFLDSAEMYIGSGCFESATFLSLKGEILEMNEHYGEALIALEEAESHQNCFDSPSALETIYYRTYSVALATGNTELALNYISKHDSIHSVLIDEAKVTAINNFQTLYETEKKEASIVRLEQANHISDLQRNFFIVLTFLFLAISTAVIIIYSNRLRHNKMLSEERIAKLEQEREVMNLQSMLYAQEEERRRIARDLHDGIGALLSAVKLHINNIESEIKKLTELDILKSTEEVIDRANSEVRRVAHNMMPGVLVKLGLFEGIEDFFDRMRESAKIKISFTYDDFEDRFENKTEVMIYRIVQELVNNTLKHASASEIKLMIKRTPDGLQMNYKDDGMGFDATRVEDPENFGLSGIKSRVNFLEGAMTVSSVQGQGVHFIISVPLNQTEAV